MIFITEISEAQTYCSLSRKNRNLYERNIAAMKAGQRLDRAILQPKAEKKMQSIYSNSGFTEDRARELEKRILEVMADENNFCRDGFSINDRADLCESNTKYVSTVLNRQMNTSFTQFLNERGVAIARKRFVDFDNYGHLTIETIVSDLGFRSRSTFSKTFKRITVLTPSEFKRMARSGNKQAL